METEIVRKLRAELGNPSFTESQVIGIMVKTRKLLDLQRPDSTDAYPTLRLYCDWTVHTELRGCHAQKIVRKMDELYPHMLGGTLNPEGKLWIRNIFAFEKFRDELAQLFHDNNLPTISDSQWHSFLKGFFDNVEDCSLKCPPNGKPLTYVDEVVLFKEGRSVNAEPGASGAPPIFWALCLGGKLRFPMLGNAKLSNEAVHALVEFEKRRENSQSVQ